MPASIRSAARLQFGAAHHHGNYSIIRDGPFWLKVDPLGICARLTDIEHAGRPQRRKEHHCLWLTPLIGSQSISRRTATTASIAGPEDLTELLVGSAPSIYV